MIFGENLYYRLSWLHTVSRESLVFEELSRRFRGNRKDFGNVIDMTWCGLPNIRHAMAMLVEFEGD